MTQIIPPLVSIITPSYNQGKFIRETIESVLSQDFKNIEHIVVDGGSTDGTIKILKEYSRKDPRFRYVSEPDNGQSHAINKGIKMAKGEIIGWLNSDDTYLPGAVKNAVQAFNKRPEWSMVYGDAKITDVNNKEIRRVQTRNVKVRDLFRGCPICQPAVFLKKKMLDQLGGVDENLDFCMDYELWIRIAKNGYKMGKVKALLANARFYSESKSGSKFADVGFPEIIRTSKKHFGTVSRTWISMFLNSYRKKGVFWFIHLFRSTSIFNNSPNISETLRQKPHIYTANIINEHSNPLQAIALDITSREKKDLALHFFLNNRHLQSTILKKGDSFLFVPVTAKANENTFSISTEDKSCSILSIAALSHEEYKFVRAFQEGTPVLKLWIERNFNR